ncbi:MAG: c-type cytochrome [Epsilonproteobacteria bacterium]|nr:c-type cytochrome [Campylobacterota bacterium]
MIKHVIATIALVLVVWASIHLYQLDKEVNKLQHITEIINKSKREVVHLVDKIKIMEEIARNKKSDAIKADLDKKDKQLTDKLQALKNEVGNIAAFKVSVLYKKNCSSCHGATGEGIIGPKLLGRSKDFILKNLEEFKAGTRKNYVMYGLLGNLNNQQLVDLATEIGTFQAKQDAANK